MNQDESQLKLLSLLHYVLGGLSALFSCIFLFHLAFGISILRGTPFFGAPAHGAPPPPFFGLLMAVMGGAAILGGWTFAGCLVVAGRSLAERKRYYFCIVVAGIACVLCNPLGMGLGIFTIIVLMRPSVKQLFGIP